MAHIMKLNVKQWWSRQSEDDDYSSARYQQILKKQRESYSGLHKPSGVTMSKYPWRPKDKETGERKIVYKHCQRCGREFWARVINVKFCSAQGRILTNQPLVEPIELVCEHCRRRFLAKMPHARFCSIRCRVASHRAIAA